MARPTLSDFIERHYAFDPDTGRNNVRDIRRAFMRVASGKYRDALQAAARGWEESGKLWNLHGPLLEIIYTPDPAYLELGPTVPFITIIRKALEKWLRDNGYWPTTKPKPLPKLKHAWDVIKLGDPFYFPSPLTDPERTITGAVLIVLKDETWWHAFRAQLEAYEPTPNTPWGTKLMAMVRNDTIRLRYQATYAPYNAAMYGQSRRIISLLIKAQKGPWSGSWK